MLAFYVDSSACKNIPVRPETNFVRPGATRDFILKGTNCRRMKREKAFRRRRTTQGRTGLVFLNAEFLTNQASSNGFYFNKYAFLKFQIYYIHIQYVDI